MEYDILSVYGRTKLKQNICSNCGCRFFILNKSDECNYCSDCRDKEYENNNKHSKDPMVIYHIPISRRRYIPRKIRLMIYKRDSYRCVYCGKDLYNDFICETNQITVDHFHPYIGGGLDDVKNLNTCCWHCNIKKRDRIFKTIGEFKEYIGKSKNEKNNSN